MRFARFSLFFALVLVGCGESKHPPLDYVPHMSDSYGIKAQREPMREAPEGTIPINYQPYHYANNKENVGKILKNPLPRSKQVLARGQKLFNTYCIVCHGPKGEGNGYVVPKFPMPPSLQSEKVRNWKDGDIYHVITMGQNLMSSYASQLDPTERWAVIHYIRVLQRSMNPTQADISNGKGN
ncbi:MAG: cytochrome c [Bacteriovoracia bacterium]